MDTYFREYYYEDLKDIEKDKAKLQEYDSEESARYFLDVRYGGKPADFGEAKDKCSEDIADKIHLIVEYASSNKIPAVMNSLRPLITELEQNEAKWREAAQEAEGLREQYRNHCDALEQEFNRLKEAGHWSKE